MRNILNISIVLMSLLFVSEKVYADNYCYAFEEGYKDGVCYKKYACIPPYAPMCPLPDIGEDTGKSGYQRGFLKGLSNRR